MTAKCDPIFKMLRKNNSGEWDEECQIAFDKVKEYLTNPPVLVPPVQGRPLILYLTVHEKSMGCVLGQHDETGRKEQAIYYLSKKFTDYESRYSPFEKITFKHLPREENYLADALATLETMFKVNANAEA